tara:strand:- start:722 stop:931 length:210 start_codon:yes stop_codon:yes gene_type:complete
MELVFTLIFVALFFVISFKMAESRGRNAIGWALAGLLVSPVVVWIILLIAGKTVEQQAEELNALKELIK